MQSRNYINHNDYINQSNQIISILGTVATILRNTETHTYNLVNTSRLNNSIVQNSNRWAPFSLNIPRPNNIFNIPTMNVDASNNTDISSNNPFLSNIFDNLTPVRVNPTMQQISRATRMIRFGSIRNPRNSRCPIRHEEFEDSDMVLQIRHCGHNFNSRCLHRWFENSVRCPMCRYDIREYNPTQESASNTEPEPEPEPEPFSEVVELNHTRNYDTSGAIVPILEENLVESQQQDLSNNTISITAVFDRNIESIRNSIVNQLSEVIHDIVNNSQDASNNYGVISIEYSIENQ